ncbi:MAG: methylenetetrahydrofolate reductase [Candidatus Sumerlaeota bacterium]|nr:methylenetetrahydrofolate reductase [Candidatus Sumerlaeota bacterium]
MRFDRYSQDSRQGPVISFEVFPPKTDAGLEKLHELLPELLELRPSFFTVTYGAMGSTQGRTLEIARTIRERHGIDAACHLTCVGSSRAELDGLLAAIHDAGVRDIVALRGDPPQGQTDFVPPADGLGHANELVAHIHNFTQRTGRERFGIAVAGYPEKHTEAPDLATDIRFLKQKTDAGADVVVTQLFFDNRNFFAWQRDARAAGISLPIIPGLLPIVKVKQIKRISEMCGCVIPAELEELLREAGDDDERAEEIGVRQCVAQARELLESGVPGIHFYVMNRSSHMRRIMQELRPLLRG